MINHNENEDKSEKKITTEIDASLDIDPNILNINSISV